MKKGKIGVLKFRWLINPTDHKMHWQAQIHQNGVKTKYVVVSQSGKLPSGEEGCCAMKFMVNGLIGQNFKHKIRTIGVHIIEVIQDKQKITSQVQAVAM
jgi:hypothetical protein